MFIARFFGNFLSACLRLRGVGMDDGTCDTCDYDRCHITVSRLKGSVVQGANDMK